MNEIGNVDRYEAADGDEFGLPVHIFVKNSREQIRISLNEYRGTQYIDIRIFYRTEGGFKPSKKGVTLRTDLYPELLNGIILLGETLGFNSEILNTVEDEK